MLRIRKLYSEPAQFDAIRFTDGVNLILGERDESSDKTNGVGKSMSIEFIQFCLLKKFSESRLARIPPATFSYQALVCLDVLINGQPLTIQRSIKQHEAPVIVQNGQVTQFANLNDATLYLGQLLFGSAESESHPSFRALLGPLMRDEGSEFKSIVDCYDTTRTVPADYSPHLYFLGIHPGLYNNAKALGREIEKTKTAQRKIKDDVEKLTNKEFANAKANLNELSSQVEKITTEMANLENISSFELVKDELIELEISLEQARTRQAVFKDELAKIQLFKGDNYLDNEEVAALYDRFKMGLGSMIKKELQEVTRFKQKIDDFQRSLIETRRTSLNQQLAACAQEIREMDERYKSLLGLLDQQGALKSIKVTIATYQKKLEEHGQLAAFIKKYDDYEKQIKHDSRERGLAISNLGALIDTAETSTCAALEQTILRIHEVVMGNRTSSFEIELDDKKAVVHFELRIDSDGSHSNEREKVFIYDLALLLTPELTAYHPGFLVHDNIFDVDQDTLLKSLNFLADNADALEQKQYILTLNSDKLHREERAGLRLDLAQCTRAQFSKDKRFLGQKYQQLAKK